MDHAITLKDILIAAAAVGGVFALVAILFGLIWLFNPFRSGH